MSTFQVAGRLFNLDRETVERALAGVLPDPIQEHYVVVGTRRFPPKQVLTAVTGLDKADFTTHQARRILSRLGFSAARRSRPRRLEAEGQDGLPHGGRQAEALAPFVGKWVAIGQPDEVLVAAEAVDDVVGWLNRHGVRATGVFRVPASPFEAEGAAPQ